jgi:hypothetical protein
VVAIKTVPDDMTYSVKNFTVKPGQYVRITLANPDEMQHNLVFVRPGSVEEVGALVDGESPDAAERNYIPPSQDVLPWTNLVEAGSPLPRIRRPDAGGRLPCARSRATGRPCRV